MCVNGGTIGFSRHVFAGDAHERSVVGRRMHAFAEMPFPPCM